MIQGDLFQGAGYVIAAAVAALASWLTSRKTRKQIAKEFTPNGGSSTRDQLNRIETAQAVAAAEAAAAKEAAAAAKEALHSVAVQVARVDVRLDEHVQYHLEQK